VSTPQCLGIVGTGLLGGSVAAAARRAWPGLECLGHEQHDEHRRQALELRLIDQAVDLPELADRCDLIVLAVPVGAMASVCQALTPTLRPDALLTDVGSVKQTVIDAACAVLGAAASRFVPAHPIAGGHSSGPSAASATLLHGQTVVLCSHPLMQAAALAKVAGFWRALGAECRTMDARQHDRVYAAVSHLPHLIAWALMASVADSPDGEARLQASGRGFRDPTRLAASSPPMWRDILLANREALLAESERFRDQLLQLEHLIRIGDALGLEQQLDRLARRRRQLPDVPGKGLPSTGSE
jgi:prephenate dehydrogenase